MKSRQYLEVEDTLDLINKRKKIKSCQSEKVKVLESGTEKTKEDKKVLDKVAQYAIFSLGIISAFLLSLSTDGDWQKWGYIFGFIGQPAWLYTTWKNKQYPIFGLAIFYSFTWMNGIYNNVALSDITELFTRLLHFIA